MLAVDALRDRIDETLARRPAVGFAAGVVADGGLEAFHAHGYADITSRTPVSQDTIFRIASISKTFTAVAVMQLWEQGLVDLDAPANDYLRAYQLIPRQTGWQPATVRHLLTHTAGVPQMVHPSRMLGSGWFGESFPLGQRLPTLAEYYRGGLRLAVEPGTTYAYTDHGFATLGQIVADISGQPLEDYLREHVFDPLGMADTDLLRSDRLAGRLATGYTLGRGGPRPVTDRQWVTAAASSIYSTPADMGRYLAALLAGGSGEHGTILKPETLAMMFAPHYQPDPRIPGMGLGFFRVDLGGHLAIEHQGILPGFNAQIFLAPGDGMAVMAFTNGARQALMWLASECGRLLGDLVGVPAAGVSSDIPQRPERWGALCGWYTPCAQRSDMSAWSMLGAGVHVTVARGRLLLRVLSPIPALYRGFPLHPDEEHDPDVFGIDLSRFGVGSARVVFSRGADATRMHLDITPLSAVRRHRPRTEGSP